jgi:hypothetical protein
MVIRLGLLAFLVLCLALASVPVCTWHLPSKATTVQAQMDLAISGDRIVFPLSANYVNLISANGGHIVVGEENGDSEKVGPRREYLLGAGQPLQKKHT